MHKLESLFANAPVGVFPTKEDPYGCIGARLPETEDEASERAAWRHKIALARAENAKARGGS